MRNISLNCSFITIIYHQHEKAIATAFKELIDPFFRGHFTIKQIDVDILAHNELIPDTFHRDINKSKFIAMVLNQEPKKNYIMNYVLGYADNYDANIALVSPSDIEQPEIAYPLNKFPLIQVNDKQSIENTLKPIVIELTGQKKPFINSESFLKKIDNIDRKSGFWDKCRQVIEIVNSIDRNAIFRLSNGDQVDLRIREYELHKLEQWNDFITEHNFIALKKHSYVALKENAIYISVTLSPRSAFKNIMKSCNAQVDA